MPKSVLRNASIGEPLSSMTVASHVCITYGLESLNYKKGCAIDAFLSEFLNVFTILGSIVETKSTARAPSPDSSKKDGCD